MPLRPLPLRPLPLRPLPLPSGSARLPQRLAGFDSLAAGLDYAARGASGFTFFSARGAVQSRLSYCELRAQAQALARRLVRAGPAPGSRVALLGETGPDFPVVFFACQYAGLIPVPLPVALHLGGRAAYVARLQALIAAAGCRLAVGSPDLQPYLRAAAEGLDLDRVATPAELLDLPADGGDLRPLGPDAPAYIQFSSGSTRRPRGVLVSQRAVTANARAIARDGLGLRGDDRACSWLPLFHDMGLVGFCLTPLLCQIGVDYLTPQAFALRPLVWLELLSVQGASIAYSPTFGYALCSRRATPEAVARLDLSRWRIAGVGGEMIRPAVLERFAAAFAPAGFSPRAFLPSYGLSEATLAVSFATPGRGLESERVARQPLAQRGEARPCSGADGRRLAICGAPLPEVEVVIRDEAGQPLPERRVGRIWLRGPSVASAALAGPQAPLALTDRAGWLDSGDLGYLTQGRLVVTGRAKDLVILHGQNIWPEDIESAVETLAGLRAGDVACFSATAAPPVAAAGGPEAGEKGTEREATAREETGNEVAGDEETGHEETEHEETGGEEIMVVAIQCRSRDPAVRAELRRQAGAAVRGACGADPRILLVPPRSLPRTSSGKLSRSAARAAYLGGRLADSSGDEGT